MANSSLPGPRVAMVDQDGRISAEWYRYFVEKEKIAGDAAEGEVLGGAGLSGGGPVSGGVTLAVATNGITNAMLRQGLASSVIGRFKDTEGNVADIQATDNGRYLRRMGDELAFGPLVAFSYTVAGVPDAAGWGAGAIIYVTNETGGAVLAFSDATNWRRVTDRAVVS